MVPHARWLSTDWYRSAEALADTRTIGRLLARARVLDEAGKKVRYRVPAGSYLLATRVVRGVGQPGYKLYSLRQTAFTYSWGRYWPASTVKLVAAIGALQTLRRHHLSGAAVVSFEDDDGSYHGPVRRLYRYALRKSTNVDYNRLMLIAGLTELNETYLTPRWGLPRMVLQRRYTRPRPRANLRTSPAIRFQQRRRVGTIAARRCNRHYPACPDEANCVTLFELQDVLRRLMLADELPRAQRFALGRADRKRLADDLLVAHNKYEPGLSEALGYAEPASRPTTAPASAPVADAKPERPPTLAELKRRPLLIYNKAGRVPGDDLLDNALIVDRRRRRRYLLTASTPYVARDEPDDVPAKLMVDLARETMRILSRVSAGGLWLQHDGGVRIAVRLEHVGPGPLTYRIHLRARRATRFDLWDGRRRLTPRRGARRGRPLRLTFRRGGWHALVVVARRGRWRRIGYRLLNVELVVP